jgi:hypothetical protein
MTPFFNFIKSTRLLNLFYLIVVLTGQNNLCLMKMFGYGFRIFLAKPTKMNLYFWAVEFK